MSPCWAMGYRAEAWRSFWKGCVNGGYWRESLSAYVVVGPGSLLDRHLASMVIVSLLWATQSSRGFTRMVLVPRCIQHAVLRVLYSNTASRVAISSDTTTL